MAGGQCVRWTGSNNWSRRSCGCMQLGTEGCAFTDDLRGESAQGVAGSADSERRSHRRGHLTACALCQSQIAGRVFAVLDPSIETNESQPCSTRGPRMRILHVIPSVDSVGGGPVEGLKQLCHVYQMGGYEVEVASLDSPKMVARHAFPARVFPLGPGLGLYGYTPHAAKWFKENLQRYDVVFINCIWQYNTLAAYRALVSSTTPYAVFIHGMLDPYFRNKYPLKHIKKLI